MKRSPATDLRRVAAGLCLIAAPTVMLGGDVLRIGARIDYQGLLLLKLSFAFFVPAVLAIVHLMRTRADRWGLLGGGLAVVGCLAGAGIITAFMVFSSIEAGGLGEQTLSAIEGATRRGGVTEFVMLYPLPGLAFPTGLLVLGLGLLRTKAAPASASILLALGAVLFPVGRIGGINAAVLASGLSLLAGMGLIGLRVLRWNADEWERVSAAGETKAAIKGEALAS